MCQCAQGHVVFTLPLLELADEVIPSGPSDRARQIALILESAHRHGLGLQGLVHAMLAIVGL